MFGKPNWFTAKSSLRQIRPVTWQGHAYLAGWFGLVTLPFTYLASHGLVPESMIWLAASVSGLVWEMRTLRRAELSTIPADSLDIVFLDAKSATVPPVRSKYDYFVKGRS